MAFSIIISHPSLVPCTGRSPHRRALSAEYLEGRGARTSRVHLRGVADDPASLSQAGVLGGGAAASAPLAALQPDWDVIYAEALEKLKQGEALRSQQQRLQDGRSGGSSHADGGAGSVSAHGNAGSAAGHGHARGEARGGSGHLVLGRLGVVGGGGGGRSVRSSGGHASRGGSSNSHADVDNDGDGQGGSQSARRSLRAGRAGGRSLLGVLKDGDAAAGGHHRRKGHHSVQRKRGSGDFGSGVGFDDWLSEQEAYKSGGHSGGGGQAQRRHPSSSSSSEGDNGAAVGEAGSQAGAVAEHKAGGSAGSASAAASPPPLAKTTTEDAATNTAAGAVDANNAPPGKPAARLHPPPATHVGGDADPLGRGFGDVVAAAYRAFDWLQCHRDEFPVLGKRDKLCHGVVERRSNYAMRKRFVGTVD